ncbi:MAG: dihydrolipoamide acetyltransferase family protein [Actinomycetota bacterium]
MGDFVMPSLGADMDAGTLLDWRVKPGDPVKRGDIIAEVDTDKAAIEIEVFEDGVVEEILVQVGEKVPVGAVLARIKTGVEAAVPAPVEVAPEVAPPPIPVAAPAPIAAAPEVAPVPIPVAAPAPGAAAPEVAPVVELHPRRTASPLARKTAAALGVDLATVVGTGPGGAITREDVARAAGTAQPAAAEPAVTAPPEEKVVAAPQAEVPTPQADAAAKRASMRQRIGMQMARSKREIPHYYLAATVDMTAANAWLDEWNSSHGVNERLLLAVLFIKAVALAIHEVPEMNGFYEGDAFKQSAAVHPGVAISLKDTGLIAPAIHDADTKTLPELMAALRDLVSRTRKGGLRASEMADPTITVTNLGDLGVEEVFGVIQPPQVALVGFGKVIERPWAQAGMIGVRSVVRLTLSADHRVSDGHRGGLFLAAIDRLLQRPEEL